MKKTGKTLPEMTSEGESLWAKIDACKAEIKTSRIEYSRLINRGDATKAEKHLSSIRENISLCESLFGELDSLRSGLAKIESGQVDTITAARVKLVESQDNLRAAQQAVQQANTAVEIARNQVTPMTLLRERLSVPDSVRNLDDLE